MSVVGISEEELIKWSKLHRRLREPSNQAQNALHFVCCGCIRCPFGAGVEVALALPRDEVLVGILVFDCPQAPLAIQRAELLGFNLDFPLKETQ